MTTVWSNMGIQAAPVSSKALLVNGDTSIASNTNSSSPTTGALVVTGGVGIGGNLFVGGSVTFTSATFNNITVTGSLLNTPSNSNQSIISSTIQTEANPRFYINGNGLLSWGAGGASSVYDVTLGRDSSGGKISVTGGLLISGPAAFNSTLSVANTLAVGGFFSVQGSGVVTATSVSINGGAYSNVRPTLTSNALSFLTTGVPGSTFSIDSSGNMNWYSGMSLSTSAGNSVYAGQSVFSYLNATTSFYLSASNGTYIKGSNDNIIHAGNHTYSGINMFTGEVKLNSSINLLNPTSGFKTLTLSSAGTLQFYSTTGTPGTALLGADSTGSQIWTAGPVAINGLLDVKGVVCDGDLVVRAGSNLALTGASSPSIRTEISSLVSGASKNVTFPDASGNVVLDIAKQTLTNKIIAGTSYSAFAGHNNGSPDVTDKSVLLINGGVSGLYGMLDSNRAAGSSKSVLVVNNTASVLSILSESTNASAENRIITPTGRTVQLEALGTASFIYSSINQRWILTSALKQPKVGYSTSAIGGYFTTTSEGNRNWIRGNTMIFTSITGFLSSSYSGGTFTMPAKGTYSFSMTAGAAAINPAGYPQNLAIWANVSGTERTVWVERIDPSFFQLSYGFTVAFSMVLNEGDTIRFYPVMQNGAGGNYKFECDGFTRTSIDFTPWEV